MELLAFLNGNRNWQNILTKEPYNLIVKNKGPYYLLKYSQIGSDFNIPMVREARGCIMRQNTNNEWICVARALDKFGNYGEDYAATDRMRWDIGVEVQEKIDGSLIKVWYDDGEWHISTNGMIDAFDVMMPSGKLSFGDGFVRTFTNGGNFAREIESWNKNWCYWFELVMPLDNPIVVQYEENRVYFLGARDMRTGNEINFAPYCANSLPNLPSHIRLPNLYTHKSLAECIAAAHLMGDSEEGYVCVSRMMENGSLLRVKVKGDEYLRLHKLRGNGPITFARLVEIERENSLDDFVAYFPQSRNLVSDYLQARKQLVQNIENTWNFILKWQDVMTRKDVALYLKTHPYYFSNCIFMLMDNKISSVEEWLSYIPKQKLAQILEDVVNGNNN